MATDPPLLTPPSALNEESHQLTEQLLSRLDDQQVKHIKRFQDLVSVQNMGDDAHSDSALRRSTCPPVIQASGNIRERRRKRRRRRRSLTNPHRIWTMDRS